MGANKEIFSEAFRGRPKAEMIEDIFKQKEISQALKEAKEKEERKRKKREEVEAFLNKPLFRKQPGQRGPKPIKAKKKRAAGRGGKLRVSAQAGIKGFFR